MVSYITENFILQGNDFTFTVILMFYLVCVQNIWILIMSAILYLDQSRR